MNHRNLILYRALDWANGIIRKYRAAWSGLTLLVMAEDSARPPSSYRVNYLIILFFAGITIVLPLAAAWSVVSANLAGNHQAAMTGRMRLLSEIALVNREREDLFETVREKNAEYLAIGRKFGEPDRTQLRLMNVPEGPTLGNSYVSMRSESRKMRGFRRRINAFMDDNRDAMGLVENRMLIYHQIPRGLPVHVEDCQYVGKFGWRSDPETGTKREFHTGVDLIVTTGKDILAPAPGTVIEVRNDGNIGYGKFIRIHHGLGITTLYAHNSENHVREGDVVRRGQVIGLVGETGRTVGPHLHYEIWFGPLYEPGTWNKRKPADPTEFLKNAQGEHTCEI